MTYRWEPVTKKRLMENIKSKYMTHLFIARYLGMTQNAYRWRLNNNSWNVQELSKMEKIGIL